MAEGVLFNIAEQILANLASEALNSTKLPYGVKHELRKLEATLSIVKAVLLDAEEKWQRSNQVRVWLESLEDAVYDADNLVDKFRYEEQRRRRTKKVRISFSSPNQLVLRRKMGHQIRRIRETLDEIKANKSFHLEERLEESRVSAPMRMRETHSFVPGDEVVGRADDKRAILEVLFDAKEIKENVSIIPIVGIGGLGKTTLAQLVFNEDEVQKHFEKRIWVCVSDVFDVKLLVQKIVKSLTCMSPDQDLDMEQLQAQLRGEIQGKRFLLVLDDVWNEDGEKWLRLERLFRGGAKGSRVLITTRSEIVAKITKTVRPYMLRGLDEEKSWTLFQRMALEKGKEPAENSSLVEVGKEIMRKCKGVPLAIKTIGRLLQLREMNLQKPEKHWLFFKDNELAKVDDQSESDIIPTLKLSYNSLPSHLKHCFALCALFLKDEEIDVQKLIKLWIAQDFVKPRNQGQTCLEDVGYEYFMDLLWRSFFQEAKEDELGTIKSCKMHDLMHDLAISVAGKGIVVLDPSTRTENFCHKIRHLRVHSESNAFSQIQEFNLFAQKNIRSLVVTNFVSLGSSDLDAIFSNFKFLRTLSLTGTDIETLPHRLCKLKHLRYLDLSSNTEIKLLPRCITRLHNLQTLILTGCTKLLRLPRDIHKLTNLRHLEIDRCWSLTHMPRGLGELTCLRTLSLFLVVDNKRVSRESGGLGELSKLNHLQGSLAIKLGCVGNEVASELNAAHLKEKRHLESLCFYWESVHETNDGTGGILENALLTLDGLQPPLQIKHLEVHDYIGARFSDWLSSLNNLVVLKLEFCKSFRHLPPLHHLCYLKELTLRDLLSLEYVTDQDWAKGDDRRFSTSSTPIFFPSLEKLAIFSCYNLKGWWQRKRSDAFDDKPSFCQLSYLAVSKCPVLTSMPLFPDLETLLLYKTSSVPLQQTIQSSSPVPPLSKLKLLNLVNIEDVETLPDAFGNLTSLRSLDICVCPNLASLPEGIGRLSSLLSLRISACYSLASLPEGISDLATLQSLDITGYSNLASLPEGIGKLTRLESLKIWNFRNLETLPEGTTSLASLRSLDIRFCPNLVSLPERMSSLAWLESLKVERCAKLASLPEEMSSLSSLQSLVVVGCTNLSSVPKGIGKLPSLKSVNGQDCAELGTHFCVDSLSDFLIDEQRRG